MHLTGTELLDWIALRRVHEDGVEMRGSEYVGWGRKVPCYIDRIAKKICTITYPPSTQAGWDRYFPDLACQPPCQ